MKTTIKIADRPTEQPPADTSKIASLHFGDNGYSLHCLSSLEEIQNIKSHWIELEQNNTNNLCYFQSFDWCHQWCVTKLARDIIEREAALRIYVLMNENAVVMILPMMELKTRFGAKILTFIADPLAQYSNVLVDQEQVSKEVGRAVWKLICEHTDADAITADRFPSGSFLEAILGNVGMVEKSLNEASFLDMTEFETWEEHHASLSKNQRKQRSRRRSKLNKLGVVTYEVSYGNSARYAELVAMALDMKLEWLDKTGRSSGELEHADTAKFLANLSGTEQGLSGYPEGAVAHALCIDGRPIAIEVGMMMRRHYYSYLGAFDWSWGEHSPGKVQIEAAQKWAKSVGLEKFDFLGDPAEYKEQWTGATRLVHSRSIPKTAIGFLYCAVWKSRLRPQLKNAYKNMGADRRKISWQVMKLVGKPVARRNSKHHRTE